MGIIINGQNDTIGPVDNTMSLLGTVSIGGTMTIEDFTNIDSVGLGTFRNGLHVTGGNVAIGHNNPASNLHIKTTSSAVSQRIESTGNNASLFLLSNNDSNANTAIWFGESGGNESRGYVQYYRQDNYLRFGTNSSERLRIHSDGKFSFGTETASAAKYTFNSAGTNEVARFESTDTGAYLAIKDNSSTSINFVEGGGDVLSLGVNSVERLRITTSGVGINETSPDTYLHVKTGTDSALVKLEQTATNGRVQIQYLNPHGDWIQGIQGATNTGDYLIYTGQSKNLTFYTSGTLRQKIQGDGKVIIGGQANQSANRDLSVVAASGNSNEVQIGLQPTNSSGGYNPEVFISAIADGSYGAHMFFTTRDTSGNRTERLRITSDGTIRQSGSNSALGQGDSVAKLTQYTIDGTTPGGVGDVTTLETISATSNGSDYKFVITKREGSGGGSCFINLGGNSDGSISFGTNTSGSGTERLRITSAGNVGINEASNINGRLHVQHDALAENILYATRYNDQTNDKPIFAVTEALMSGMSSSGLVIGNHNRDIHIGPVFDNAAAVSTTLTSGIRITFDGKVAISDDFGSTLPSNFPASDVQLMVYTSTNGQPISNTNCARMLLATDAKQTGPQGYNGAIDFGNSDCTASGQNSQFNYRVASIMSQALADTESNAADGNLEFWTKTSSGSLSQKMGISAEGYVTKPNHPLFDAVRNSGHISANAYINFNTVKANNGGHYNSSNGRFTAPVAGYYFFSWTSIKNNTNTVTRLYIHKNGSSAYGNRHLRLDAGQDYGDNGTMTAVIQLAENDYVQIYLGAGAIYGVTEEYCIFNGYLLG